MATVAALAVAPAFLLLHPWVATPGVVPLTSLEIRALDLGPVMEIIATSVIAVTA